MGGKEPRIINACQNLTDQWHFADQFGDAVKRQQHPADFNLFGRWFDIADQIHRQRIPRRPRLMDDHPPVFAFNPGMAKVEMGAVPFHQRIHPRKAEHRHHPHRGGGFDNAEIFKFKIGFKSAADISIKFRHHIKFTAADRIHDIQGFQHLPSIIRPHHHQRAAVF